jgi:CTP:molybdopterin cytidylyltransferase MocA
VTVAAVVLAASPESALADADGLPAVRRIADVAWSGGAVPIIVVAHDPSGAVAAALAGAPVTLAHPAPVEGGPAAQMVRGFEVAMSEIHETDAALIWPARLGWVGPETVTSLIEAHGTRQGKVLRPAYDGERGWPALVPVDRLELLRSIGADRMPDAVLDRVGAGGAGEAAGEAALELGDPGVTHDLSVARRDLPPYVGPSAPAGGHVHEWGSVAAEVPDDAPLEGPALAPYGQAGAEHNQPG